MIIAGTPSASAAAAPVVVMGVPVGADQAPIAQRMGRTADEEMRRTIAEAIVGSWKQESVHATGFPECVYVSSSSFNVQRAPGRTDAWILDQTSDISWCCCVINTVSGHLEWDVATVHPRTQFSDGSWMEYSFDHPQRITGTGAGAASRGAPPRSSTICLRADGKLESTFQQGNVTLRTVSRRC